MTDEVAKTSPDNTAEMYDLWRQAATIWLTELPDVPILEFYHRIIMNTARWDGWPQGDASQGALDVTGYVNEAWWHLTWSLVIHMLEPAS